MKFILLALLLFTSCASKKVLHHPHPKEILFPPGRYIHEVSIKAKDGKEYSLKGVVELAKKTISVVGLSAFDTTIFRLKEDQKFRDMELEIYEDGLKKKQNDIKRFYYLLREILVLRREEWSSAIQVETSGGNPIRISGTDPKNPWKALILGYDRNNIPEKILIQTKHFTVTIGVTEYEV